jgi:hypothetical protein
MWQKKPDLTLLAWQTLFWGLGDQIWLNFEESEKEYSSFNFFSWVQFCTRLPEKNKAVCDPNKGIAFLT